MRELRKDELAGLWQLTEAALAEQRTLGPKTDSSEIRDVKLSGKSIARGIV
jgi:hypothetical protein